MNSFNHYSLGSVGEWLYSGAAGIQPGYFARGGYKNFVLAPQFTTRLKYVRATLDTPYGVIASSWYNKGDQVIYDVTIPPNTTGNLFLPIWHGPDGYVTFPAGTYHFKVPREMLR